MRCSLLFSILATCPAHLNVLDLVKTINVQVYAPTKASTEEDIIEFYNLLDDTLKNYKAHRTFVMGDFNSKIGHRDYGEEEVSNSHKDNG